MSGTQVGDKQS